MAHVCRDNGGRPGIRRLVGALIAVTAIAGAGATVGAGTASAWSCTSRMLVDRYYVFTGTAGSMQDASSVAVRKARAAGHYGPVTRLSTVCG